MTSHRRLRWAGLLSATTLLVAAPATAAPADETTSAQAAPYKVVLPAPTGPYRIGTTELHLVDQRRTDPWVPGRVREVMASVWYPTYRHAPGERAPYMPVNAARALAEQLMPQLGLKPEQVDFAGTRTHALAGTPVLGRHPVVLYSPGFGTSRLVGTNHAEELASRGYVVVTLDHTGEAPVEFPGGVVTGVELPNENSAAFMRKVTATRVADTRFLLDSLETLRRGGNPDAEGRALPRGLGRSLDLRRTAMFGYSLGGLTAGETMLVDRRVDAGVNMDGTMMYDFAGQADHADVVKQGLDRPFLLFGAMGHHHRAQPGTPMYDLSWTAFWQRQRGWKLDLQLAEGTHGAFADYQFIIPQLDQAIGLPQDPDELLGKVDPERSVAAQRAYLGAFVDRFLKHRPQPLLERESPRFPDVTFVK